ncbi:MAG: ABC transporter permease [Planctomycetota bacterium]
MASCSAIDLIGLFVWRDLKARYEGSFLGKIWPLLHPALFVTIYYVVFVQILTMKYGKEDTEALKGLGLTNSQAMGLFLITGILPWICFSESIQRCTNVVIEHASMIKKIAFPSELLVSYVVAVQMVYFIIGLCVYFPLMLGIAGFVPARVLLLPIPIVLQGIFMIGVGLFLGALNVFLRDTAQAIGLVLMLWMFLTPVFYPEDLAIEKFGSYAVLMELNPLFALLRCYRNLMFRHTDPIEWHTMAKFALFAIPVFIAGLAFYRSTKGRFADEV